MRAGGGIRLTPGGRRLAAAADEILGLVEHARRGVGEARDEVTTLHVAATADVAEHGTTALLDAFSRRNAGLLVRMTVASGGSLAGLLTGRRADAALGPQPRGIDAIPFLRYELIVLAAASHPLAERRDMPVSALADEPWLAGPAGSDPATATGAFFAHAGLVRGPVRCFESDADARAAAARGEGVVLTVAHVPRAQSDGLVALDVHGMPLQRLWYASMLGSDRRTPAAWALRRFVTTPEATQAMLARATERFRPAVHVELWS